MLIKFKRDAILKPLTQVIGFVEKKQTMPILSNVYLKKTGDNVIIVANDLEIQATLTTSEIEGEDFTITLPGKKFQDVLRSLPSDDVTLEFVDNKVNVKSGRAKFVLQSLPADHYPLLQVQADVVSTVTMSQKELRTLLGKIQYSMAANDTRIFLNGMLFEIKENDLNLVATDAHRLGFVKVGVPNAINPISSILPRKTILELYRLIEDSDEVVTIKFMPTQVVFETGNKQLITKILEGKYPDYTRVIPVQNDKLCLVNREEFLHAVQRVAVIGIDKLKTLTLNLKPNLMTISCRNEEQEESRDELVVQYGHDTELQVNINLTYVLEVLQNTTDEYLQWAFFDNQRSILVTVPNAIDFKYVIMPMRA